MNLVVTYKDTTLNSSYTFTPKECRLKIGVRDLLHEGELKTFASNLSEYFIKINYPYALRGKPYKRPNCEFFIQLQDCGKHALFTAKQKDGVFSVIDKRSLRFKLVRKYNFIKSKLNEIKNIIKEKARGK